MIRAKHWSKVFVKAFAVAFVWMFFRNGFPTTSDGLLNVADTAFLAAASVTTGFFLYEREKGTEDGS